MNVCKVDIWISRRGKKKEEETYIDINCKIVKGRERGRGRIKITKEERKRKARAMRERKNRKTNSSRLIL